MRTKFYLDGKKITKKALQERIGEERLKRMMQEAKETFLEDPLIKNDFYLGREGMLTIEFCETYKLGWEPQGSYFCAMKWRWERWRREAENQSRPH